VRTKYFFGFISASIGRISLKMYILHFFSLALAAVCQQLLSVKNEGHIIWRSKYLFCCITQHTQTRTHRSREGATLHTNHTHIPRSNSHTPHNTHTTHTQHSHHTTPHHTHPTTQIHAWKPSMFLKQHHTHTSHTTPHNKHVCTHAQKPRWCHTAHHTHPTHIPHTPQTIHTTHTPDTTPHPTNCSTNTTPHKRNH